MEMTSQKRLSLIFLSLLPGTGLFAGIKEDIDPCFTVNGFNDLFSAWQIIVGLLFDQPIAAERLTEKSCATCLRTN